MIRYVTSLCIVICDALRYVVLSVPSIIFSHLLNAKTKHRNIKRNALMNDALRQPRYVTLRRHIVLRQLCSVMLSFVTHINGTALRYVTLTCGCHHLALHRIAFVDFTLHYSKYVKSRHAILYCVTCVLLRLLCYTYHYTYGPFPDGTF